MADSEEGRYVWVGFGQRIALNQPGWWYNEKEGWLSEKDKTTLGTPTPTRATRTTRTTRTTNMTTRNTSKTTNRTTSMTTSRSTPRSTGVVLHVVGVKGPQGHDKLGQVHLQCGMNGTMSKRSPMVSTHHHLHLYRRQRPCLLPSR